MIDDMTKSSATTTPIDLRTFTASPAMQNAVLRLCALKRAMDRISRDPAGQPVLDDWMDSDNSCAYTGHSFLSLIIPFLNWPRSASGPCYAAYVDPRHVLSSNISGFPEQVPTEDVQGEIERYARFSSAQMDTRYSRYPALGFILRRRR